MAARAAKTERIIEQSLTPENAITHGSGNVFADLGFEDAEERLAKAQLVQLLGNVIRSTKLSQRRVAEILGIDQPKVSELLRGRTRGYSLERLFAFFKALNQDVLIVVKAHETSAGQKAQLKVCEDRTTYG